MYALIYMVLEEDKLGLGLVWVCRYILSFPRELWFVNILEKAKLGPRLDDNIYSFSFQY